MGLDQKVILPQLTQWLNHLEFPLWNTDDFAPQRQLRESSVFVLFAINHSNNPLVHQSIRLLIVSFIA